MALNLFNWIVDAQPTQQTELKVNVVTFADGYEQLSSSGINNKIKNWSCSKTGPKKLIDIIYIFLLEHGGKTPFIVNLAGEVDNYRTVGMIEKTQISGDAWRISFNLKQVFLPGPQ